MKKKDYFQSLAFIANLLNDYLANPISINIIENKKVSTLAFSHFR